MASIIASCYYVSDFSILTMSDSAQQHVVMTTVVVKLTNVLAIYSYMVVYRTKLLLKLVDQLITILD